MGNRLLTAVALMAIIICGLNFANGKTSAISQTGTVISGEIASDTTWNAANSPYNFSGSITIMPRASLIIEAGTIVNTFNNSLQVDGTLRVQGENANPVVFVSANQHIYPFYPSYPAASIYFSEKSLGSIENAILNSTTITSKSTITLKNDTFNFVYLNLFEPIVTNCTITGSLTIEGTSIVTNNTIMAGGDYYGNAINSNNGSPIISHNVIKGMPSYSLVWGLMFGDTQNAVISDNTISDCSQVGILAGEVNFGKNIIERNLITNNFPLALDDIGGVGIEIIGTNTTESNLIIRNNTITNNSIGINIHVSLLDSVNITIQPTISGNNIFNNSHGNLFLGRPLQPSGRSLLAGGNVNASYNWWGTVDERIISQSVFDHKNDSNVCAVTFIPYLTEQNPQAAPDPNAPTPSPFPYPVIMILSPVNGAMYGTVQGKDGSGYRISLFYESNDLLSWVGYSIDGNSNVTLLHNDTIIEVPPKTSSHVLLLFGNDTLGRWVTPQTVSFQTYSTTQVLTPSPSVPEFPSWIILPWLIVVGLLVHLAQHRRAKQ